MKRSGPLRRKPKPTDRTVVAQVMARDGHRCLLDGRRFHAGGALDVGRCFGPPTPHHLRKRGQGGPDTVDNLVTLCAHHNGWVEDHPIDAHALGLVVRTGSTTTEAWSKMRANGLVP